MRPVVSANTPPPSRRSVRTVMSSKGTAADGCNLASLELWAAASAGNSSVSSLLDNCIPPVLQNQAVTQGDRSCESGYSTFVAISVVRLGAANDHVVDIERQSGNSAERISADQEEARSSSATCRTPSATLSSASSRFVQRETARASFGNSCNFANGAWFHMHGRRITGMTRA